jgi:Right handed beta helix region
MDRGGERRSDRVLRRHGGAAIAFTVLLAVMLGHEAEHLAQVGQKDVLLLSCPNECRGLLGHYFDVEWVHFVYNGSILVALAALAAWLRVWQPQWRWASRAGWSALVSGVVLQTYHFVEHTEKLQQWLHNGHRSPTPGFAGQLLDPAEGRNFSLIELHFLLNTVVLVAVLVGYFGLGFHRRVWAERTPPRLAIALAVTLVGLIATGVGFSAAPPTVRLAAGVHQGPIVLDYPQRLVGSPGTVVRGGIIVTSDDVVLEHVRIDRAALDGIAVRDASVAIRDCEVRSRMAHAQGIDISFTHGRRPSLVERCQIQGGREGILVDGAEGEVRDNRITGTSVRAISINEMAMAHVIRNHVQDVRGNGLYCGDYSMCELERNTVERVRPNRAENRSLHGIGIVSDYHARADLEGNVVTHANRRNATFAGASFASG